MSAIQWIRNETLDDSLHLSGRRHLLIRNTRYTQHHSDMNDINQLVDSLGSIDTGKMTCRIFSPRNATRVGSTHVAVRDITRRPPKRIFYANCKRPSVPWWITRMAVRGCFLRAALGNRSAARQRTRTGTELMRKITEDDSAQKDPTL